MLADNFSGDLANWEVTTRGLEQNAEAGYDPPAITGGAAVLGGTTNNQYWYGSSLESLTTFDSRLYTEVSAKRVSLTGSGTAYRSSVWIFGDATHYLHLSQNVGEGGWSYNANDAGGGGTLLPTGGGTNLEGMDGLDADAGLHQIKLRLLPTGATGGVNIEIQIDGVAYAVHGFTNFPTSFKVILTGQGRATGDTVSATFDDVTVAQPAVANQPPAFDKTSYLLPTATVGTAYSYSDLAAGASDPDGDTLTFAKVSGPTWVTVAANGTVSGMPDNGVSTANILVRASDPKGGEATVPLIFRVNNPAAATPPMFGWWPFNETSGNSAADISGSGNRAAVTNAATGGLGTDGSVWVNDPGFGRAISFNGVDGPTAGWAVAGAPPVSGILPTMDLSRAFTWSFWAKSAQGANNDIILGNRFNASGVDFGVPQFTKFTGSAFEWYLNGTAQNIDYPDIETDVWAHHVVVKDGGAIFYYRDGVLIDGRVLTLALTEALPVNFGGGANGGEAWSGYLQDARLFNGALSETGVKAAFASRGVYAAVNPTFTSSLYYQLSVKAGVALSRSVASLASDPQGDALTFSKVSGPEWLSVSANGTLSGTPDTAAPSASTVVKVQDLSGNSATSTFIFRVEDPAAAVPGLFGSWPLDDGSGATARDSSGSNLPATISNPDTGGLSDTTSVWLSDPQRGTVLSFEGTEATGAQATVGTPPDTGTLPPMDAAGSSFTWAFWAKPDQTGNNDIILGNRYNETGVDFAPVQFIKFTSSKFEWYVNGVLEGIDYPDLEPGVWAHHAVVKEGNALFYYRNGVLAGQSTVTLSTAASLPVFFGGGTNGVENWRGALSDINLYNGSISESAVAVLATPPIISDGTLFFTSITVAPNRAVTLNWNGVQGKTYNVYAFRTTSGFQKIGESTTSTFTLQPGGTPFNTAVETRLFFRVAEKPAP
ncbi:MAG: LamG-like jellyroll fold domain-containing protein [Verrucomicrobiota bacterium]